MCSAPSPADTNPPHPRENLALPQHRSWPLHLLDCGGHAGIAQLHLQLQKALFPHGNPTSANSSPTLPPTWCPNDEDFSLDSLGLQRQGSEKRKRRKMGRAHSQTGSTLGSTGMPHPSLKPEGNPGTLKATPGQTGDGGL